MVIAYLQKMFGYALKQNENCPGSIKRSLEAIVPHAYGDHEKCGQWCGYRANPSTYRHSGLLYGKDLSNPNTRRMLTVEMDMWVALKSLCHLAVDK